jgi:hypothetical protein
MFLIGDPIRRHRPPQTATGGHRAAQAAKHPGSRTSQIHGKSWKSLKIDENPCKSMKIHVNPWKSMKIYENLRKSMKIYRNLLKSMKINENLWKIYGNLWKSMKIIKIHDTYGMYLLRTEKMGYILCSKHIHASHICPPKRNKLIKQRIWKSWFSGKHGLWPANYMSKWHFLWKPEMIPRSLRSFCPSRFAWKPR